ncbi:SRPBCC family protein [Pseudonocardia sp. NPDC046786]|uniref:SRPBCC family protein n=1 Tax=Pseudonocardia sp. NPDC046786 TaxID=3155471 RepID=UPI0033FCEC6B
MILQNSFVIDVPVEDAWKALNDPELVAPCFPGAALTEFTGDTFAGVVKVKLGPISLTYKGEGVYVERDDAARRVLISATGRDSRGNGTAKAQVTGTVSEAGPGRSEVRMTTDMAVTGRPAQFGRGVISDVADKMIGQFATCLATTLAQDDAPAAPGPGPATAPAAGISARPGQPAPSATSQEALDVGDLLSSMTPAWIRRWGPAVGVAVLLAFVVGLARRRS